MDTLPVGWTLHTCDQEGDRSGLLRGADPDISAVTHVCDLFHEDAQVGIRLHQALSLELFLYRVWSFSTDEWPLVALLPCVTGALLPLYQITSTIKKEKPA